MTEGTDRSADAPPGLRRPRDDAAATSELHSRASDGGDLARDLERRVAELETLLDVIPIGIGIARDPQCREIRVNEAFARQLGIAPDANASKSNPGADALPFRVMRQGRELAPHELPLQRAAAEGVTIAGEEIDVLRADGGERHLLEYAAPLRDETGHPRGSVGAFVDITDRVRSEQALALIADATTALASSLDYAANLTTLGRLIVPRLADWCVLYTAEPDGTIRRIARAAADSARERALDEIDRHYPVRTDWDGHYAVRAMRDGAPILSVEVDRPHLEAMVVDARNLELMLILDPRSVIAAPLIAHGRTLGAIVLAAGSGRRKYEDRDALLIQELARRAALAIEHGRLYGTAAAARADAESAERRASFLAMASEVLASSLDYEATLASLARLAVPELGDRCIVDVLHEGGRRQRLATIGSDPSPGDEVAEARASGRDTDDDRAMAAVLRTGEPAFTSSFLCVPMIARDRVLGALALAFGDSERRFTRADQAFAEELARRAALAVDNAWLYEAEQRARRAAEQAAARMARLQAATAALSEALTPAQVAEVVLYHGITAMGARGGGVCLVTEDGSAQELVCVSGFEEQYTRLWSRFAIDMPGPVNDVVRERALVVLESLDEWRARYPALAPAIAEHGYEAFAGVPLEVEGRVLGSLSYNFAERRSFTEGDASFLRAIAQQAGQALERSRLYADALAANKAKADFLAVMSHELRTPLTAILGYAELLGDGIVGPVNEVQREQLARIRGSGTHLLTLIEEILSFARIEAGQETVRPETLDAGEVARGAIAFVEPLLQRKGLRCELRPPAEPVRLHTDGAKLLQILTNLLANAVKFTERGGVEVEVAREGLRARFTVRDSGIGIPAEHIERIFDPFWQVEQSATRRAGGTGLGLSVVKRLAQLLGGEVTVASRPGEGSEFTLTLPAEGADDRPPADD